MKNFYFMILAVAIIFATGNFAHSQANSMRGSEHNLRESGKAEASLLRNSISQRVPTVVVKAEKNRNVAAGTCVVNLKADDVWQDGTGYIMLLDDTHTQFGQAIPDKAPLTTSCNIPADLKSKFSHFIPEEAVLSCTPGPGQQVVTGEVSIVIPAGIYDYCIANPFPGIVEMGVQGKIFIAGGEDARADDFEFLEGYIYTFEAVAALNNQGVQEADNVILTDELSVFTVSSTVEGGNGTLTPSSLSLTWGAEAVIQIVPADNYELESFVDNGEDKLTSVLNFEYKIPVVSENHTIVAKFKEQTTPVVVHKITASVEGGNGEITPTSTISIEGGEKIFVITPAEGFIIDTFTDNEDDKLSAVDDNKYVLSNIVGDHNIVVKFKVLTFDLTATVEGGTGGTITPGSKTVNYNEGQVFEIAPAEGYRLFKLTDNGEVKTSSVSENKYTLAEIKEVHEIVVTFKEITYDPITNLNATLNGLDVTLSWIPPMQRTQVTIFEDGFENGGTDWTIIDADGDGENWEFSNFSQIPAHSGIYCAISRSFLGGAALTPNNYLITPELLFVGEATISFWVASQDPGYLDKYEVLTSSTGNTVADFSNPPLLAATAEGEWTEKTLTLPAGTKYVAFRHTGTDKFMLKFDDVKVVGTKTNYKYTIYEGETKIVENLQSSTYTIENVAVGNHNYCVEVNYPENHNSTKECKDVEVVEPAYATVTNLQGEITWLDVKLSWTAPETTLDFTYTLTKGETVLAENITETSFVDASAGVGTHNYCVKVNYPYNKHSEPVCKEVVVATPTYAPVTNLEASVTVLNVSLTWTAPQVPVDVTYTVYLGTTALAEAITTTSYVHVGAAVGTHNYCVKVNYAGAQSAETCKSVTVEQPIYAPVTNLNTSVNNKDITLTWTAPAARSENVILEEGFEAELTGWTLIDADGDTYNWFLADKPEVIPPNSGNNCYISASYMNADTVAGTPSQVLTPDNYLITPELNLPSGGTLTYSIASQDPGYRDHYGVFTSTTGKAVADFGTTPLHEEVAGAAWTEKSFDLPAGTKYVAFRHYNSSDKFCVKVDDIKVTSSAPSYTYSVYRNDVSIAQGISETTYKDLNLEPAVYNYCVEVNYGPNQNSDKVCKEEKVVDTNIEDVLEYRILVNGGNACMNFDIESRTELTIYDATGRLVTKTVKEGVSSDIFIPGMYLVHYNLGNVPNVIKVVVR